MLRTVLISASAMDENPYKAPQTHVDELPTHRTYLPRWYAGLALILTGVELVAFCCGRAWVAWRALGP